MTHRNAAARVNLSRDTCVTYLQRADIEGFSAEKKRRNLGEQVRIGQLPSRVRVASGTLPVLGSTR